MTDPTFLADLATATGPSRELDARIADTLWRRASSDPETGRTIMWRLLDGSLLGASPEFTKLVDVALTLVPEGCEIEMRRGYRGLYAMAKVWSPRPHPRLIGGAERPDNELALAVCFATMEARSHES